MVGNKEAFAIRFHHYQRFRILADAFSDTSTEGLAEEWTSGLDRSRPSYRTATNPEARERMKQGFVRHIRDIRDGKPPIFVDGNPLLDPICAACMNEGCGDSQAGRQLLKEAGLIQIDTETSSK